MGTLRSCDGAQANLKSSDAVVIEATTNTWTLYDTLAPLVGKAVVANSYQVKLIAAARQALRSQTSRLVAEP